MSPDFLAGCATLLHPLEVGRSPPGPHRGAAVCLHPWSSGTLLAWVETTYPCLNLRNQYSMHVVAFLHSNPSF